MARQRRSERIHSSAELAMQLMTAHGEAKAVREYVVYLLSDIFEECEEAVLVRYAIEGRPATGDWEDEAEEPLREKARLSLVTKLAATTAWKRLGHVIVAYEDRRHDRSERQAKAQGGR